MPSISIAMTTCNGAEFLEAQLHSLSHQTRLPAELIVSDDASTDATKAILSSFARHAPFPVRFHENDIRIGYRQNFMRAVGLCQSNLIAFCDQDDVWEPHKLATMERVFDKPDIYLAFHNATVINRRGWSYGGLYRARLDVEISAPLGRDPWIVVPGFTQMFRRELTRFSSLHCLSVDVYWPNETQAHDQWFYFLASVLGRIAFVGEPLVRYRQHGRNAFGWYPDTRSTIERALLGQHFIRGAIASSKACSDVLQRMLAQVIALEEERVISGIGHYDALHRRLLNRLSIYESKSALTRMKALYAFARNGGYSAIHGAARFGWKEFLVDAYVGVPFGRLIRCLSSQSDTKTPVDEGRA